MLFRSIRKVILDNTIINQIVDLDSGVFNNVTASTVILQLSNIINTDNKVKAITEVKDIEQRFFTISDIPQFQFKQNTSYTFNIFGDDSSNTLTRKIAENKRLLGSYCKDIIEGIVAHKHLIQEFSEECFVPMLEGKCIKRFYNQPENKYLLWDKKQIHRARPDYLWDLDEKILIQRISGGAKPLVATIDKNKFKTFASVNNLVLKPEYDDYYCVIVALLNSNVINWYYANNFSNNSKLTVNISKTYLEMLPIPNISNDDKKLIDELVEKVMEAKAVSHEFSELEIEIDLMVYKLYGLTYDEVLTIDPKAPITQQQYEQ